jgi:hypothetical protein
MFNLEHAISEWRRQMAAGGIKTSDLLNELESHLRDDVDRRMQSGLPVEQAFEAAVRQMGPVGALNTEFDKLGHRRERLRAKFKGVCGGVLAASIALVSTWGFPKAWTVLGAGVLLLLLAASTVSAVRRWRDAAQTEWGLNKLAPGGQEILDLAREEAPRMHHNYIGTEHVLLGLTRLQTGIVPNLMKRLGLSGEDVRREIEQVVMGFSAPVAVENIPYTPRVKKALLLATKEAKVLNHDRIGSEDIFLGLLLEGDGVAARVLKKLGVEVERTREVIEDESARD